MAPLQFLAVCLRLKEKLIAVIGVSDLMFFTTCVSAARRLGWSETPALVVPLVALLSALGVGLFVGFTPGLPFLAVAMLLYAYASHSLRQGPCQG